MKIKDGFILRKIANQDVVVPVGNNIADFNGVITLNETAAFLWNLMKEEIGLSFLIDALMKEYDISRELAQQDIEEFISRLQEKNILNQSI